MYCEPCKVAALIRWLFTGISFYKDTNYSRPILWYWWFICRFDIMAKATKKKPAKEASNIFHNIMVASVKGNPKPVKKKEAKKK